MKSAWIVFALLTIAVVPGAMAGGEIYGRIATHDGKSYSGAIRWDRNENFWDDVLDGSKKEEILIEERKTRFRFFGIKIGPGDNTVRPAFSIPFGHLASLTPDGDDATLTLKTGESIAISGRGSSDVGHDLQRLEIEDPDQGVVELRWQNVKRIDFGKGPGEGRDAERLFGRVETTQGEFTGYLVWDRDESLLADIIDGEDEERDDREIPLREIRSIEKLTGGGSRLQLTDDSSIVLRDTNDIDDGHRGVRITLGETGVVDVPWEEFKRVEFLPAPKSRSYDAFDGGHPLRGTVHTRVGRKLEGAIVWDRDESYTWETLDGDVDALTYNIPFSAVAAIEPAGDESARIELRGGQTLLLSGSNDVNGENKGVRVTVKGQEPVDLTWDEIRRVEFTP